MENESEMEQLEPGTDPDNPSTQISSNESDESSDNETKKDEKKSEEFKESQAPKIIFNRMIELLNKKRSSSSVKKDMQVTLIILGLSGVGKTYILEKVGRMITDAKFNENVILINIDKFGSIVNGKWTINVRKMISDTKVKDAGIYEGVSDNMDMVLSGISNLSTLDLEASFYIKPELDLFRSINALKFQEGSEKGLPPTWLKGWQKNSEIQGDEYDRLIARNLLEMTKLCEDEDFPSPEVIVNAQESEIKNGWHKG